MTLVDLRGCGSWVRIVAPGGAVVAFHRLQKVAIHHGGAKDAEVSSDMPAYTNDD
ncbi:MAG: hypothetical protein KatS3mg058_1888 [Roseiflexus sp.]|nr:MAG: hypothetical protein KatS3mg058_1888 [Roseiflexus sp.]